MSKQTETKSYSTGEIAELLGLSRQSIHNAMKSLGLDVEKDSKGYHLTAKQANQIAKFFGHNPITKESKSETPSIPQGVSNEMLSRIIDSYDKQLASKDEMIEQLNKTVSSQNETINRLLDEIKVANDTHMKLLTASAVEKTADSVERMNAIVPREDDSLGFAARLKFLFTGRK